MKKIKSIFLLLITIIIASCCDIIEEPYTEGGGVTPQDTMIRKVLLEDYTGFKCVNCPSAAHEAHLLKQFYGEQLVVMAVHAGYFAEPDASGNYTDDLTTTTGDELNSPSFFHIQSYPSGMVNRREFSGNRILSYGNWGSSIAEVLQDDIIANIEIIRSWEQSTQTVSLDVCSEFFVADANTYKLCVYLAEDSIITWQKNNSASMGTTPDIQNYVQMHVLRDAVNSTWGDEIVTGGATIGLKDTSNYSYDFSVHPGFDVSNCTLIAFIYDSATYEIIQVEAKHVK
jgi:Outer membrane protein Omp28